MDMKTSWNIVKGVIAASVAVAVVVIAGSFASDIPVHFTTPTTAAPTTSAAVEVAKTRVSKSASEYFIGECAQMDMTNPSVRLYAVSECVGRVRGFVDAHNVMVAMVARAASRQGSNAIRLFCVDPNIEADKLVASIMDWADAHVNEYTNIMLSDPRDGATVVIITALHAAYPCANT